MSATFLAKRRREVMWEAGALVVLMLVAFVVHVLLLVTFWIAPTLFAFILPEPPPPEIIEVAMVDLKHTDNDMAEMDVTTAPPPAPVDTEAPDPVEQDAGVTDQGTTEPVETPNPSDLTYVKEDAEEQKKGDPDTRKALLEQMEQAEREKRRRDMLAALGTEDSEAGDPNSTASETVNLGGSGRSDPELARYIDRCRKLFYAKFHPLPQLKSVQPPLVTKLHVKFDVATGRIQSWSFSKRSGNASWDGAAERAIEAVQSVPPPPASLHERLEAGMLVTFSPEDA